MGCGPWAVPACPLGLRWKRPTSGPHGQPEAPAGRSCSLWGRDRWVKGLRSAPMCPPRVLPAQPAAIRPLQRAGLAGRHTPPTPTKVSSKGPPQESAAVSRTRSLGWGSGSAEAPPPTMPPSQLGPTRGWGWLSFGGGQVTPAWQGLGGKGRQSAGSRAGGGLWPCLGAAWDWGAAPRRLDGSTWDSPCVPLPSKSNETSQ